MSNCLRPSVQLFSNAKAKIRTYSRTSKFSTQKSSEDGGHLSVVLLILKDVLTVDAPEHHVVNTRTAFFPNRSCHRFNCFQMRGQRYELILEHPNFQRRKMIRRTDPVILSHQPSSIELMWRRRGRSLDNFVACFRDLSRDGAFVHTSLRRIGENSWNQPKITVTLHQQK